MHDFSEQVLLNADGTHFIKIQGQANVNFIRS